MTIGTLPCRAGRKARLRGIATLAAALLVLAGCDGLFEVDNPTNILDEDLTDPQLLDAIANTPQGALSLSYDFAVTWAELVGDAGFHASTRTSRLELDEGTMGSWNETYEQVYNDMSAGRWMADDATRRLEELLPNPQIDRRVGEAYFWTAIARITLADLFEEVTFDGGPPVTPRQVIRDAIERLEIAAQISGAAGDANYQAAALGSLARAYRSLYFEELHYGSGADPQLFQQAEAYALQALSVRGDFRVDIGYSPPGSSNAVYAAYSTGNIYDNMDPRYANRIDPVGGGRDPRIQHRPLLTIATNGKEVYEQLKYDSHDSDIPVSRWQEAELIIAEHRYMQNDYAGAVARINNVRAAAGLPDFSSNDPAEIWDQLMYERETEFWLELRRWQDHRYYEIIPEDWIPANKALGVHRRWPVSVLEKDTNPAYR